MNTPCFTGSSGLQARRARRMRLRGWFGLLSAGWGPGHSAWALLASSLGKAKI